MPGRIPDRSRRLNRETGFTYLGILFAVVLLGMALATAGTTWAFSARRDKERQLLWAGEQYRRAIASYYLNGPAGMRQFPRSLEDLLADERGPALQRHLRRLYADPMTGDVDWQLERLADGGIVGLRSASEDRPIKQAGFAAGQADFEEAGCYCDWVFAYRPVRAPSPGPAPSS